MPPPNQNGIDTSTFKPLPGAGAPSTPSSPTQAAPAPSGAIDPNSFKPLPGAPPQGGGNGQPTGDYMQAANPHSLFATSSHEQLGDNGVLSDIGGAFQGAGEGIFSTLSGAVDMAHKHLGVPVSDTVTDTLHDLAGNGQQKPAANQLGYGGETLMEFLSGEEALKALSIPEKLAAVGSTWKVLENSPKLLATLKLGAAAMKAGTQLSPEEAALVKQYPRLAKLISMGVEAGHAGATQGAQTLVRTGGDVKQAAADAAVTAATVGTLHAAGAAAGAVAKKGAQAAEATGRVSEAAKAAASKPEVLDAINQRIGAAENALHENYESGINDLKDRLSGAEVSASDNPLAEHAKTILSDPPPGTHPAVAAAAKAQKDTLAPAVKELLETVANGSEPLSEEEMAAQEAAQPKPSGLLGADGKPLTTETPEELPTTKEARPYTVDDLIDLRQRIRKTAENYDYGSANSRALRSLLNTVDESGNFKSPMDDTIQKLAEDSGDDTAVQDYKDLRSNYRDNITHYDNPVIKSLREGKIDDAAKNFVGTIRQGSALPTAGKIAQNTATLKAIVGDPGMKAFGKNVFGTILKDSQSGEAHTFNPERFMGTWNRIDEPTKQALFGIRPEGMEGPDDQITAGLKEVTKDAKSAANLQRVNRYLTAMGAASAAGSVVVPHLSLLSGVGLLGATGGSVAYGRELLDYIANHPNTIKAYLKAGQIAENPTVRKAASTAASTIGTAAANAVSPPRPEPTGNQQSIMDSATQNLSGK
jgi:hypothetical protein